MRVSSLAILSILLLGTSVCAQNVQLALDGAADLSPVYPTARVPANVRQLVAIFVYGDQKQHKITTHVTGSWW
jgi:isocitrate lyase